MNKRLVLALWVALTALSSSACFTVNASLPGTLRGDIDAERDCEKVGKFEAEVNHWFIPCGLGEAPEAQFRKELLRQARAKGADGVANVKFEAHNTLFDIVLGRVCPVIQPRTFKLSGDLVRIKKPPLPGNRPSEAPPGGPVSVENDDAERPEPSPLAVAY